MGRTFRNDARIFVYPWRDQKTEALTTVENLKVPPDVAKLYGYLVDRGSVLPLPNYNPDYLPISPREAGRRIQTGDSSWEKDVPPEIAKVIKERALFGYKPPAS